MWRNCVSPGLREAKVAATSLLLLTAAAARSSPEVPDAAGEGSDQEAAVSMALAGAGFSAVVLNEMQRQLGSFQMCAPCTCCGEPRGVCILAPCCYAINCNIPNCPFIFCSFPPRSCDCIHYNVRKVDLLDGVTILHSEKVMDEIVLNGSDLLVSRSAALFNQDELQRTNLERKNFEDKINENLEKITVTSSSSAWLPHSADPSLALTNLLLS